MAMQINTSKWSPSDVLRQRVMGAMEREAQYQTALLKQQQAIRKEVITTEAMRDYNAVAGSPDATREQVYSATQRAIGRIMGVDPEAAKNLAANSANYPKFFPTDLSTSELEAYLRANKDRDQSEVMVEWDRIQNARKQATMQQGTGMRVQMVGQTPVVVTETGYYDYRTQKFVQGKPDVKAITQPSEAASGAKERRKVVNEAIQATADIRVLVKEAGGIGALQDNAKLYNTYKSKVVDADAKTGALPKDWEDMTDAEKEASFAKMFPKDSKSARDPAELAAFGEKLRIGRDYIKKYSKYVGMQGIVAQEGIYVDPNTLEIKELDDKNRPLGMQEKYNLNEITDWGEVASGPDGKAMLMKHTDPSDPANFIPAAAEWLRLSVKKAGSTPRGNFVEKP